VLQELQDALAASHVAGCPQTHLDRVFAGLGETELSVERSDTVDFVNVAISSTTSEEMKP
jgi:hypothetical protein